MPARTRSAAIMMRLRLSRSFKTPDSGAARHCGNSCRTTARATAFALPVSSSSRL